MLIQKLWIAGPMALVFAAAAWSQNTSPARGVSAQAQAASAKSGVRPPLLEVAQEPGTTSATPAATETDQQKKAEKHWNGDLVDLSCMAKKLQNSKGAESPSTGATPPGAAHFAGEAAEAAPQGMPQPGGAAPVGPGAGNPNTTMPGAQPNNVPSSGMSRAQEARMAQAQKIDKAARACVASPATRAFGLAMSGGQVVQFDTAGDAKAARALKAASPQPGKKVKAKVTGTLEKAHTVAVGAIEIKGKRRHTS